MHQHAGELGCRASAECTVACCASFTLDCRPHQALCNGRHPVIGVCRDCAVCSVLSCSRLRACCSASADCTGSYLSVKKFVAACSLRALTEMLCPDASPDAGAAQSCLGLWNSLSLQFQQTDDCNKSLNCTVLCIAGLNLAMHSNAFTCCISGTPLPVASLTH